MTIAPGDEAGIRRFILANTRPIAPPHVPEITLHLADEAYALWERTEEELGEIGVPPPFWAFAWAGGQGLARYVLDHPETVASRRVLDFATGSGLVAIAAAMAGAARVEASDIDPWAVVAADLNAGGNRVVIEATADDRIGLSGTWDVVLAGDVFYDRAMTELLLPWFSALVAAGTTVLIGDPGRSYCPKDRLRERALYRVPVIRALEDSEVKLTRVWEFGPEA